MGRDGGRCDWVVIHDPSNTFTQRNFRLCDLRQSAKDSAWPEGIAFRNIRTQQAMVFRRGQLTPTTLNR
jgi:hypothetical protein